MTIKKLSTKRIISLILLLLMITTVFSGCGSNEEPYSKDTEATADNIETEITDTNVYSSGTSGIAFKTDSCGAFFMSAAGLCYADEDKEVSMIEYTDVSSGVKSPIQSYNGEELVCVGDKVYYSKGVIYEIQLTKNGYKEATEWISNEDMEEMELSYGDYNFSSETYIYNAKNLQYCDGFIYYSKELAVSVIEKGQIPTQSRVVSVIGRIDIETKDAEVLLTSEGIGEDLFDYVVSDGWIYYNCVGTGSNAIRKARVDGSEDQIIYEGFANDLTIFNDRLYFTDDNIYQLHSVNLEGDDLQIVAKTENEIKSFTIDSQSGNLYFATADSIYEVMLNDLSVKKIIDVGTRVYHITCVDSKIYIILSEPMAWTVFDWGLATETDFGSKDSPMITGLCYDIRNKTARASYTYLEYIYERLVTRRFWWKQYNNYEFRIPYRETHIMDFKIYE